ncbi:hypothetical protein BGX27_002298 [Mortierella sp. AM989]|nr:hypothetical protein BGX27_002298 [Mortierella sp. AM989]
MVPTDDARNSDIDQDVDEGGDRNSAGDYDDESRDSSAVSSHYDHSSDSDFVGDDGSGSDDDNNRNNNSQEPDEPTEPRIHDNLNPGHDVNGLQLPDIDWKDHPFLASLMVYTELGWPNYIRAMGLRPALTTLEVNNRVILYQSSKFTDYAGMRGILLRQPQNRQQEQQQHRPTPQQLQNVLQPWWDFLTNNNQLFGRYIIDHILQPVPLAVPEFINEEDVAMIQQTFVPAENNNTIEPAEPQEFQYLISAAELGPHENVFLPRK